MTLTSGQPAPDAETIARWWVQLCAWTWPDDLPGKPDPPEGMSERDWRYAIRGAHSVIDQFADEDLVAALWQDDEKRNELIRPFLDQTASTAEADPA